MIELGMTDLAALCLAVTCCIISGIFLMQEIGEINRKKSDAEQISCWWMYPGKMSKIRREYKSLYPFGRLDTLRLAFQFAAYGFLVLLLISLGAFK